MSQSSASDNINLAVLMKEITDLRAELVAKLNMLNTAVNNVNTKLNTVQSEMALSSSELKTKLTQVESSVAQPASAPAQHATSSMSTDSSAKKTSNSTTYSTTPSYMKAMYKHELKLKESNPSAPTQFLNYMNTITRDGMPIISWVLDATKGADGSERVKTINSKKNSDDKNNAIMAKVWDTMNQSERSPINEMRIAHNNNQNTVVDLTSEHDVASVASSLPANDAKPASAKKSSSIKGVGSKVTPSSTNDAQEVFTYVPNTQQPSRPISHSDVMEQLNKVSTITTTFGQHTSSAGNTSSGVNFDELYDDDVDDNDD